MKDRLDTSLPGRNLRIMLPTARRMNNTAAWSVYPSHILPVVLPSQLFPSIAHPYQSHRMYITPTLPSTTSLARRRPPADGSTHLPAPPSPLAFLNHSFCGTSLGFPSSLVSRTILSSKLPSHFFSTLHVAALLSTDACKRAGKPVSA